MLKADLVEFVLTNVSLASCFFIGLYCFLVSNKWSTSGNPGCFKRISGINLTPANQNLFIISFILYIQSKIEPCIGILSKPSFIPNLLSSPLASCSLINLDFYYYTSHMLINALFLLFLPFKFLGFYFSYFFYTSNNKITQFYK